MININEAIYTAMHRNDLSNKALSIEGMSGKYTRYLLNTLLSQDDAKYLEIGCWKGSTLYSTLLNNNPKYAVAIDNFSEFGSPRNDFQDNMKDVNTPFIFFDENCFALDKNKITEKFNIYFYDGAHEEHHHFDALSYFYDLMDDTFIYLCDDWNWDYVRNGTRRAISELNLKTIEEREIFTEYQDKDTWWNGLLITKLKK